MATLEEKKARRRAIQFCVQTVLTSNDSVKYLKGTAIYSGISRNIVVNGMRFRDGWTESTQHGRKHSRMSVTYATPSMHICD